MEFQFIDNSTAKDSRSRKAIRSHVMKGKNVGKTIRRGRKHAAKQGFFQDIERTTPPTDETLFPEITASDDASIPINPFAGREFSYFAFPVQFTSSMRNLVYQFHSAICDSLYPHAFCRPFKEADQPWFEYMIMDQAFLHCLLGMTATYISVFRGPEAETLEATRHFSQTLRLVNRDLSKATVPEEPTVAVVVSLTIHSNLVGEVNKSCIHLDGLQKMLDLRPGGLLKLRETNHALMLKICRTDIDVAMLQGTGTRFGSLVGPSQNAIAASLLRGSRSLPSPLEQLCPALQSITQDVLILCRRPGRAKMEGLQYQDIMTSICQRLLDYAPLRGPRPQVLDDVWHLGLLAFMTTFVYATGSLREIYSNLLHPMLRDRVASIADHPRLQVWLLFICGLTVHGDRWPLQQLREAVKENGLRTWEDAKAFLQPYPWIGVVNDGPGKALWAEVAGQVRN